MAAKLVAKAAKVAAKAEQAAAKIIALAAKAAAKAAQLAAMAGAGEEAPGDAESVAPVVRVKADGKATKAVAAAAKAAAKKAAAASAKAADPPAASVTEAALLGPALVTPVAEVPAATRTLRPRTRLSVAAAAATLITTAAAGGDFASHAGAEHETGSKKRKRLAVSTAAPFTPDQKALVGTCDTTVAVAPVATTLGLLIPAVD